MSKKPRKREDLNEAAHRIVAEATGQTEKAPPVPEKNPAAVELGRRGGLIGGKARAAKLTKDERVSIAKNAAAKRWADRPPKGRE